MTDALTTFELLDICFIEMPEGVKYEYGTVTVPEFHDEDNGRTITLGLIRLLSTADTLTSSLMVQLCKNASRKMCGQFRLV